MVVLKSKGFRLRPVKKEDAHSIAKNINNKKIARNTMTIPYPYKLKHAKTWIAKAIMGNRKKKKENINFIIDINGEAAGSIGLIHITGHKAEIGYWLAEKHWNKGIMTRAVKLVTGYAFEGLRLRRIYAHVRPSNKASARVLEKTGYKYEGLLRKDAYKEGKYLDSLQFAKVR